MNWPEWTYLRKTVEDLVVLHPASEDSVPQTSVCCHSECKMFSQVQVWTLHLGDPDMHSSPQALTGMQDSAVTTGSIHTVTVRHGSLKLQ